MNKTLFYTGKGDRGDTARLGGKDRLSKSESLLDTIGTLDEATSAIGVARSLAQDTLLQDVLPEVQRRLSYLMAHLSAVPELRERYVGLSGADVIWLEELIARLESDIPPLDGFVLPGESPAGAACHLARAIVRRAERRLVACAEQEPGIGAANLAFVNRLSSLLFVAALREDGLAGRVVTSTRAGE